MGGGRAAPILLGFLFLPAVLVLAGCSTEETEDGTSAQREELARQLQSLPYVTRAPVRPENRGKRGVVLDDSTRTRPGYNLYGSLTHRRVYLGDMAGELVHQWEVDDVFGARREFPLLEDLDAVDTPFPPGLLVAELHGGRLLAIESHVGLVALDEGSRVEFALRDNAHHDLDTDAQGRIYVLTAAPRTVKVNEGELLVVDDVIQVVSPAGEVLEEHSVFEILATDPDLRPVLAEGLRYARHWFGRMQDWEEARIATNPAAAASFRALFDLYEEAFVHKTRRLRPSHEVFLLLMTPADVLHTNTLQLLDDHPGGLWRKGNVLVSVRNLDLVAVLDLESGTVAWWWGPGELSRQHQPSVLPEGNLLVFDNGTARGLSRIVELDPVTRRIVWSWEGSPEEPFFCGAMGGVQRLPGGNTLITDSSAGRAFEVDATGTVVWDFFNPDQGFNPFDLRPDAETIESIYRLTRVAPSVVADLLGE